MFNGKAIKTQFDDALAVLDNKSLADRLAQSKMKRLVKSETESGLVIKAMRECPACGAKMTAEDVDCPECGKMVGKAVVEPILPEEMKSAKVANAKDAPVLSTDDAEEVAEAPDEEATEDEAAETADDKNKRRVGNARVEAESTMTMAKSDVDDELMADASVALDIVQKAIAAPGGDRTELLAQAANLVNAVRDYAHSIANTSAPADVVPGIGGATAEAVAATQDLNPAPQPGQKVGGNQPVVPEEAVTERPQMTDDQEDAVETPEEQADETPVDEQEEGRLHFAKQPNNENKKKAMKPPVPIAPPAGKSVKARTQPNAVVKSAAKHPAEAFVFKWASSLAPILSDVTASRTAKREAVQKALNDFAPAVVKVIEDTTPATERDLSMVVQDAIQTALAERDSQYKSVIEQLQRQVVGLTTASEVGAQMQRRPFAKKSFSAQRPDQQSIVTPSTQQVALSGDQVPVRRLSAAEVAKSSVVSAGGSYIRY